MRICFSHSETRYVFPKLETEERGKSIELQDNLGSVQSLWRDIVFSYVGQRPEGWAVRRQLCLE